MKILILLFTSFFGFGLGLVVQNTVRVDEPAEVIVNHVETTSPVVEQPVRNILLDTVEVTAVAPAAVALN